MTETLQVDLLALAGANQCSSSTAGLFFVKIRKKRSKPRRECRGAPERRRLAMSKSSEALLSDMQQWASNNQNVSELWLLGGQLRDEAQPGSDVELAIVLMTPTPGTDWALTNYFDHGHLWQSELERIIGRRVSLQAIRRGTPGDRRVRSEGTLLWERL